MLSTELLSGLKYQQQQSRSTWRWKTTNVLRAPLWVGWSGVVISALSSMRWATVSGLSSRCRTFISVCNQPPKANSAFHPSWVGAGFGWKGKAGTIYSVSGSRGVQMKLWYPLRTRAITERFRGVSRQGAIQIHVYLTLPYLCSHESKANRWHSWWGDITIPDTYAVPCSQHNVSLQQWRREAGALAPAAKGCAVPRRTKWA